eukprot:4574601-Prymnesium_polylepis.2
MATGQFDKIMMYCQKVSYTPNWGELLTYIVRQNPAGALEFAQNIAKTDGITLDYAVVADVFMQHNCLQQCTSFLLDVLKGNKPEEAALQTRLLEMNLMAAPQARALPPRAPPCRVNHHLSLRVPDTKLEPGFRSVGVWRGACVRASRPALALG